VIAVDRCCEVLLVGYLSTVHRMLAWISCTGRKSGSDAWLWILVQPPWRVSGQACRPTLTLFIFKSFSFLSFPSYNVRN